MGALLLLTVLVLWAIVAIKTWSFIITDLVDQKDRLSVVIGFVGGLFWPLTYILLTIVLIAGVFLGQPIRASLGDVKLAWKRKDKSA
jgi:hypothetical protein